MTSKNKIALSFLIFIVILSGMIRVVNFFAPDEPGFIKFNDRIFPVLVAASNEEKFKGLSGQKDLGKYFGMYFYFGKPAVYTMVMRDMLIPLDIIWLKESRIIEIKENLQPEPDIKEDQLIRYSNLSNLADAVLEMPAGTVKSWNMKPGEVIVFCKSKKACGN